MRDRASVLFEHRWPAPVMRIERETHSWAVKRSPGRASILGKIELRKFSEPVLKLGLESRL